MAWLVIQNITGDGTHDEFSTWLLPTYLKTQLSRRVCVFVVNGRTPTRLRHGLFFLNVIWRFPSPRLTGSEFFLPHQKAMMFQFLILYLRCGVEIHKQPRRGFSAGHCYLPSQNRRLIRVKQRPFCIVFLSKFYWFNRDYQEHGNITFSHFSSRKRKAARKEARQVTQPRHSSYSNARTMN